MTEGRKTANAAHYAASGASGAAMEGGRAAGHAAVVAHMTDHELGAAAYAIRAVRAASGEGERDGADRRERVGSASACQKRSGADAGRS